MEVHFTPDIAARLEQFAASEGKKVSQVVEETVARAMERRAQFLEDVERGIGVADRGEFNNNEEVRAGAEKILPSRPDIPFASAEEKARAFEMWARSHPYTSPLSNKAVQRENLVRDAR